jgi:hypothetical protein
MDVYIANTQAAVEKKIKKEENYVKIFSNLNIFLLSFSLSFVDTFLRLLAIVGTRRLQKLRDSRQNDPSQA